MFCSTPGLRLTRAREYGLHACTDGGVVV
jgi:hypothetical protein